ncbi:MAG: thiamine diphosphokinase [Acidimicrobiia bacterium]
MHALVFAGGDPPDARAVDDHVALIAAGDCVVIAADSGVAHALALDLPIHLVIGDLDSADPDHVGRATAAGARIDTHPADKDMTDLELALHAARDLGASEVTVLGAGGGRLDHLIANLLLLAHVDYADLAIEADLADARVTVVRGRRTLDGAAGSTVTLLALGGPARGVTTTGLRWALHGDELIPASTRGVSNEIASPPATVHVESGVLLAVQPRSVS